MRRFEKISMTLKILAHPVRLQIVAGLLKNECNVSQVQQALGLPQSTISQHLRILKDGGIIRGIRKGTTVCYKVINNCTKDLMKIINK
jgi:DNA-binding transcriptional ArsR family regulator